MRQWVEKKLSELEHRLDRLEKINHRKPPLVFLGPSFPVEKAKLILDADYRSPIRRGDLPAAIQEGYYWIGIVDGTFHQNFTVSIVEIRQALNSGAKIYGSSSIGALRAVEAHTLGMIGIGQVFDWYYRDLIDADDEVAICYDEQTGKALSDPLVNIRATLDLAKSESIIDDAAWNKIFKVASSLHFSERTYPIITEKLKTILSKEDFNQLKIFFKERKVDLKAMDTKLLLERMKQDFFHGTD